MTKNKQQHKVHVKQGDQIQIISGTYKGTIGIVQKIIKKTGHVIISNVNLKTKHVRSKKENKAGEIIKAEAPIHSSNVMLYSNKEKTASRYRKRLNSNHIKERILNKTGEVI